jgi:hypothetical protein
MSPTSRSLFPVLAIFGAVALTHLASTDLAHAQPRYAPHVHDNVIHGVRFEAHGNLGWGGFLGAGFDVEIPIVPNGFLPARAIHDEFALVPGFDLLAFDFRDGSRGVAFAPQVTAQWNLYVHRRWSVFPEVGMAVFFVSDQYWYHDAPYRRGRRAFVDGVFAFGARRHFTDRVAVTMRLGWPFGAQAGVTF